ncbi:MAG: sulfotransferase [Actinomycetota bacterium]
MKSEHLEVTPDARLTPFPFIVGCSRSGKSLLKAMLDAHPGMAVAMESHFVAGMAQRRRRYEGRHGFRREVFLRDLVAGSDLQPLGLGRDDVRLLADRGLLTDLPQAIRELFALYAGRRGKWRYGNRTGVHVMSMPWIASLLPEAKFLHVIRDGRDVALALARASFGPSTLVGASMRWRRRVRRGRADGEALGPSRYREIRYEDLVTDPEDVVRSVCEFIRLDYDPRMLRYHDHPQEIGGIDLDDPDYRDLRQRPTAGLQDWRKEMDEENLAVFNVVAGKTLERLGYPASGRPSRASTHLRARARAWGSGAAHVGASALRRAARTLARRRS